MALNVETGSGLANADSYITLAEADTYLAKYGFDEDAAWTAASDAQKEDAIRRATQEYLEGIYYNAWRGSVRTYTQKLSWPRTGAHDDAGRTIGSGEVPDAIKEANALVALNVLQGNAIISDGYDRGGITRETMKGVGFEITTEYGGGGSSADSTQRRLRRADSLIYPYIAGATGVSIF